MVSNMYVTVTEWHKPTLLRGTGSSFILIMLTVVMLTGTFAMLSQQQLAFLTLDASNVY
jgi:hypothetical protein